MNPGPADTPDYEPRADGRLRDWPTTPPGEAALFGRLRRLCEEGLEISARIEAGRPDGWHSFVPAEYETVLRALLQTRGPAGRFLELGSATGVITIIADLLGFEAYGVEIAPELVAEARALAARYDSGARFATGSYLPKGFEFVSSTGDSRLGAVTIGAPAYPELGFELADFDCVYAYPWPGESEVLRDLMRQCGKPGAQLLLHGYTDGIEVWSIRESGTPVNVVCQTTRE